MKRLCCAALQLLAKKDVMNSFVFGSLQQVRRCRKAMMAIT
jgi:hypothetical protein